MKRKLNLLCVLFFLLFTSLNAQTSFYYYKGEKINLTVDRSYLHIIADKEFIESPSFKLLLEELKMKMDDSEPIQEMVKLRFQFYPTVEEYTIVFKSLKENKIIQYVLPYFERGEAPPIGTSDVFYVKLKEVKDTLQLWKMAEQTKVQIIKQVPFMPLWYIMSIRNSAFENSIVASNYFYETGFFADTDPAFMFDFKTNCTNDPDFNKLWGLKNNTNPGIDINVCDAWTITRGAGINVAVIDQAIDFRHNDLADNIHPLSFDAQLGTAPSSCNYLGGHGTHVAGTVGAVGDNNLQVVGVAYESKIMGVSHHFYHNSTTSAELASGVSWAWQNGADVMNNSWGAPSNTFINTAILEDAIMNAMTKGRKGKGTVVVFAAGNSAGSGVGYPGCFHDDILVVGAIDTMGLRAGFSSYGKGKVDVMAPGLYILSTLPHNDTAYWKGTSMAAPHVSGVAALILSVNPNLKGQQVRDIIESTAKKIRADAYTYDTVQGRPKGTWHEEMGHGLVDAYEAVLKAKYCNDCAQISISDSTLNFKYVTKGITKPLVLNIQGIYLTDDLMVNITGNGFSSTTTTITKEEAMSFGGYDITVNFTPLAAQAYLGTLTLSGSNISNIVVNLTGIGVTSIFCGGIGTINDPYEICDAQTLFNLAAYVNAGNGDSTAGKYYILTNDIDLSCYVNWEPIGKYVSSNNFTKAFQGYFDGNNHILTHLTINRSNESYIGLFGYLQNANIKNLGAKVDTIKGNYYVGGLVGYAAKSNIDNCHTTGNLNGNQYVGGLVGYSYAITNSYSSCNVNGYYYVGGLSGATPSNILSNCHASGNINGDFCVGGLAGYSYNAVSKCYTTGSVSGNSNVGGLVGCVYTNYISNCYAKGNVTGNGSSVGGLIGYSSGNTNTNCYATGKVTGYDNIGGLIGECDFFTIIRNCVAVNDSIVTTNTSANIHRIVGNGKGVISSNYVLEDMVVIKGTQVLNIANDNSANGWGRPNDTLTSLTFYATASNWLVSIPWNISGIDPIWTMCSNGGFPYLSWQVDVDCQGSIFCGGIGTQTDPYQICNAQTLTNLATFVNTGNGNLTTGKYYILTDDIDLNGFANWVHIGKQASFYDFTKAFQGNFDGNNHVVSHLTINRINEGYIGLFGCVKGTSIKNLSVEIDSICGNTCVGCLVGFAVNSKIFNCKSTGIVNGNRYVSGLVGYADNSNINNCYSNCIVTGNSEVGGLAGCTDNSNINNCYSTGKINGNYNVGGLAGCAEYSNMNNCYSTGKIKGNCYVGGLVGYCYPSVINNCVAANDTIIVTATNPSATINRIAGDGYGSFYHNYALENMIIMQGGQILTIIDDNTVNGWGVPLDTLTSLTFYATASNWLASIPWNITGIDPIWTMCSNGGFPYLSWQDDVDCQGYQSSSSHPNANVNFENNDLGIEVYSLENAILLYPNPASHFVELKIDAPIGAWNVELFDMFGRLLIVVPVVSSVTKININDLPSGIYFVSLHTVNTRITKKLIKK